jgi:GT2 family glycosyltransferase
MSSAAATAQGAAWLGWDGRTLRFRLEPAAGAVELCLDGAVFERIASGATTCERRFDCAPGGNEELMFALHDTTGRALAPEWRVRFDRPAPVGTDQWQGPPRPLRPLAGRAVAAAVAAAPRAVAIVVPVYNSAHCVQRCLAALARWTGAPARLILIDDASDDPAVPALLARAAAGANVCVRRNPRNLGYTRSCNLGIELAGRDDVVLLNSDTEVGPRWLERLREIARADATIGTVTAVSDNAGAFSVPELEHHCPIPAAWTLPEAQRALLHHAGGCLPELPTGNGFCMYVKRELFDRVGVLDAAAFPAGYGEENDLCQRAARVGFRHVIAGDVLVHHARSASFGDARRAALGAQGMAVLRARYPDYEANVGAMLWSFERRVLDWRVRRIYAEAGRGPPPRPRVLLIGETAEAARSIAAAVAPDYETFFATPHGGGWQLRRFVGERWDEEDEFAATVAALRTCLIRGAIELVHFAGAADADWQRAAASAAVPSVAFAAGEDPAARYAAALAADAALPS